MPKWIFYVLVFVYMCYRAVYGGKIADTSISVDEIHYDEEETFLQAGTRITVSCKASNKNQKLEWKDPSGQTVTRSSASRVYAHEQFISTLKGNVRVPSLVLIFSELTTGDSGVYQCKSGDQKKDVPVCVMKPSEFVESEDTPAEVTIEAGRSITLACQATGDPEPTLTWKRNDVELTEDIDHPKYKVNRRYKSEGYESLLTITDVDADDAGLYYCVSTQENTLLDNCNYSDEKNVTLLVQHKPIFEDEEEPVLVYGSNSEIVNIKCEAQAWPEPTYRWFKKLSGGSVYEYEKSQIVFSEDPQAATLAVTAGPTTYDNIFKCTATNEYGEAEKSFKLLKREKPSKPDHIVEVLAGMSFIHLNVSWDDEVNFPISGYNVQYIPSSKIRSKKPMKSDWEKTIVTFTNATFAEEMTLKSTMKSMFIKLDKVDPDTEYFVRVKMVNNEGEGLWSEPEKVSSNDVEVEEEKEEDIEEAETTEESEAEPEVSEGGSTSTGMFYGIFFTGGILIVAVVCMFAMRLV